MFDPLKIMFDPSHDNVRCDPRNTLQIEHFPPSSNMECSLALPCFQALTTRSNIFHTQKHVFPNQTFERRTEDEQNRNATGTKSPLLQTKRGTTTGPNPSNKERTKTSPVATQTNGWFSVDGLMDHSSRDHAERGACGLHSIRQGDQRHQPHREVCPRIVHLSRRLDRPLCCA